jgi:hypothetical protein
MMRRLIVATAMALAGTAAASSRLVRGSDASSARDVFFGDYYLFSAIGTS